MKNTKFSVFKLAACMLALAGCILLWPNQQTYAAELQKDNYNGWYYENGQAYWYDNGVLARSKEVYDPQTDAWYWFEADGTMARDKDVFIVLNADGTGKWTRYDSDGRMVKGESYKNGAWYYFDTATGKMAHGKYYRDGAYYYYDTVTGIMQYGEQTIDGDEYYFDTETGAMVTGEVERDGRYYYYDDETGAMLGLGEQIVKYAENFRYTLYVGRYITGYRI